MQATVFTLIRYDVVNETNAIVDMSFISLPLTQGSISSTEMKVTSSHISLHATGSIEEYVDGDCADSPAESSLNP